MSSKNNSQTQIGPWKKVNSEIRYENPWIKVTHEDVIQPDGNKGIYGKIHFKNIAIGIIPISEDGYTWLVGQHRYPLDEYSWEIPEGGGPHHIDPILSAQRELKEETGLVAKDWKLIQKLHISNSVSDEYALIYLATGLSQEAPCPEGTEEIKIKKIKLEEAVNMALDGKITDSMSVAGLLKVGLTILK
ncbi:NUDIX domain-containing protein [Luteibaculum oceani]|uniref:GDP-mannose pyrophosphatase n=1 Tax=Luteibaculum oceani TaxID=1294296 RepID=A0A5C6V9I5_9FLAO|nr:NUDIX hydrolase [Luteibaculum oceani]TXC81364.1 NUDIX hydrolase [Luteibaculum oceani]